MAGYEGLARDLRQLETDKYFEWRLNNSNKAYLSVNTSDQNSKLPKSIHFVFATLFWPI